MTFHSIKQGKKRYIIVILDFVIKQLKCKMSFVIEEAQSHVYFLSLSCYSMKRRRVFLPLPLLPTITETLEDAPVLPASTHTASTHAAQIPESLDEYMTSIQALARPAEAQSGGLVRLQRSPKPRQFLKAQVKLSASHPRGSSRTLRTSRQYGLSPNSTEDFSLKVGREKDCRFKDPVDWLFGQVRT